MANKGMFYTESATQSCQTKENKHMTRVEMMETTTEMSWMDGRGQSQQETQILNRSSDARHKLLKIGAWKVRTIFETRKKEQATLEMDRYSINISSWVGVRCLNSGKQNIPNVGILFYFGKTVYRTRGLNDGQANQEQSQAVDTDQPGMIRVRFNSNLANLTNCSAIDRPNR